MKAVLLNFPAGTSASLAAEMLALVADNHEGAFLIPADDGGGIDVCYLDETARRVAWQQADKPPAGMPCPATDDDGSPCRFWAHGEIGLGVHLSRRHGMAGTTAAHRKARQRLVEQAAAMAAARRVPTESPGNSSDPLFGGEEGPLAPEPGPLGQEPLPEPEPEPEAAPQTNERRAWADELDVEPDATADLPIRLKCPNAGCKRSFWTRERLEAHGSTCQYRPDRMEPHGETPRTKPATLPNGVESAPSPGLNKLEKARREFLDRVEPTTHRSDRNRIADEVGIARGTAQRWFEAAYPPDDEMVEVG